MKKVWKINTYERFQYEPNLSQFLDTSALSPSNTNPTIFKNSKNSSCINFGI